MKRIGFMLFAITMAIAALSGKSSTATLSVDDMEGIFLQSEFLGITGSMYRWNTYLFLKNGEGYQRIDVPIDNFDVDAMKEAKADRWGTWQADGDGYVFVESNGKENKLKPGWHWRVLPGDVGEDLSGRKYSVLSTFVDPTGTLASVVSGGNITFLDAHRYVSGKFSGMSGQDITVYTEQNLELSGTYRISGYTIEFEPDQGEPHRELFFFGQADGGKDYGLIGISGNVYLLED